MIQTAASWAARHVLRMASRGAKFPGRDENGGPAFWDANGLGPRGGP